MIITEIAWEHIDPQAADAGLPVAVGGSLAPHRILEALRYGAFPMPCTGEYAVAINRELYHDLVSDGRIAGFPRAEADGGRYAVTWWCPPTRPVIPAQAVHLSRKLRRDLRHKHQWITTCDHAFAEVVAQCRDRRGSSWITDELRESLLALHLAGWAHSVEVWNGEDLIGGVFGIGMGAVFSAESTFHRQSDAGKAAIADLGRRLALTRPGALIDVQVASAYSTSLGATPLSRTEFLAAVADVDLPLAPAPGVFEVAGLADAGGGA